MSAVLPANPESNESSQASPLVGSTKDDSAARDGSVVTESQGKSIEDGSPLDAKVVFLTHYIPLYQVRVLQEITKRIRDFQILLSTPIEPNRNFRLDWSGLNVEVQKTVTLRRRWRHAKAGFDDQLFVHVPYDTLKQLKRIRPDVVISHELGARSLAAARYCRRSGARLVLATFMSEQKKNNYSTCPTLPMTGQPPAKHNAHRSPRLDDVCSALDSSHNAKVFCRWFARPATSAPATTRHWRSHSSVMALAEANWKHWHPVTAPMNTAPSIHG